MGEDVPLGPLFGLVAFLILLSACFSGSETALMSLNRYQLRHKAREGHRGARIAEHLLKRPDRLLGLILFGNNLVNFTAASLVGAIARELGGTPAQAVGTIVLTLIVLIFAETAPKTWAALHPERLAFPAALVYYPLLTVLLPFIWLINVCSNAVLWLLGVRQNESALESLSREELRTIVHEAGTRISTKYQRMLISILDLERVTVDDVMVPRNEILGIDLEDDEETIDTIIRETSHTRVPVFRDSIDDIVGILHMRKLANRATQSVDKHALEEMLEEPYFVPEGTPLSVQLIAFQRRPLRLAMVVDEYGDIQGIVTLEDILEEIVGEFTTDTEEDDSDVVEINAESWLVDATANVRELNRSQGWELPTDGPKTINGLIVEQLETIPEPSTCLKIAGYPIEVVASDDRRVRQVKISQRMPEEPE